MAIVIDSEVVELRSDIGRKFLGRGIAFFFAWTDRSCASCHSVYGNQ